MDFYDSLTLIETYLSWDGFLLLEQISFLLIEKLWEMFAGLASSLCDNVHTQDLQLENSSWATYKPTLFALAIFFLKRKTIFYYTFF